MQSRQCPICKSEYFPSRQWQRSCSPRCTKILRYREDHARRLAKAREWKRNKRTAYPWHALLDAAKYRAKKSGREYTLTPEWAELNWTGRCAITGLPFAVSVGSGQRPAAYAASIDRIDSTKGYTPENSRFVLAAVNFLKHDMSDEDMYRIAEAITLSRKG